MIRALSLTLLCVACVRPPSSPRSAPHTEPTPDASTPASDASTPTSDAISLDAAPADALGEDTAAQPSLNTCRSALAMPPPRVPERADAFAPRPATAPAVVRTCESFARATRHRLSVAFETFNEFDRAHSLDPLLLCADAGDGAWTFSVTVGRRGPAALEGEFVYPATLRPVFVTAAGEARVSSRALSIIISNAHFTHAVVATDVGVFDWSGDGRAELFFHQSHEQEENQNSVDRASRWWTFAATGSASPREFARAASNAANIADYDRDGRPDILLRSPWVVVGPCGLSDVDNIGPRPLLHSVTDGRFVEDDVSHAWLARQCPERPTSLFDGIGVDHDEWPNFDQPQVRVACARLYGASADTVAAQIAATYPPAPEGGDSPASCYPRDGLTSAARVDPPGAFRLSCDEVR